MADIYAMLWVEVRKALRSGMPLWTVIGSCFFPLGLSFLIFVARNPQFSAQLGLVSGKANLFAYASTDWTSYLALCGQVIAAGGFFLFVLVLSWTFGREFSDGVIKDMLAVPIRRSDVLLAKYIVFTVWCLGLTAWISLLALGLGFILHLPGASTADLPGAARVIFTTSGLTIAVVLPFSFFASIGRGYLLPLAISVLAIMSANLAGLIGWGPYYPWAIAGLYAQGSHILLPISAWVVLLTALGGMGLTAVWWIFADQTR